MGSGDEGLAGALARALAGGPNGDAGGASRGGDRALVRVYGELARAAEAGQACPSNRALCDELGIATEARVTRILATLRGRRLIDIEWTRPAHGARRVVIRATGTMTGWSRLGPAPADTLDPPLPRDGMRALARALKRSGGRFHDVTLAEARRIAADTPADPGMPAQPAPSSYMSSPLGALQRAEPDENDEPFIERRQ
jgi:hypothetical protein